ncbi:GrpB family protein [Pararhizobium sp. LjRoot235]|uniref:GrpB family protein n=1 Tax=Pararhizobium sp. LjRoot235 TaxID=3342291 RepID=UPI003F50776C
MGGRRCRHHPDAAAEYAALKYKLAAKANGDWKFYTGGKSDYVASIVQQASTSKGHAAPALISPRPLLPGRKCV